MRFALYFTPAPGSALAAFGDEILGPDDALRPSFAAAGLAAITRDPRVYGFHATLRPPMRLGAGVEEGDLFAACEALARHRSPIAVGRLAVALVGDFVALVPEAAPPELGLLAAECVAALDPLRAPLSQAERERRRPERLDPRGRALLERWGYPYVFEAFRFHMTLTGPLACHERESWCARLAEAYADGDSLFIDAITLLRQDGTAPFRVMSRISFHP